ITALCMDVAARRQARLELRIERPAAAPDWTIRRIEWLEPAEACIALRPDDPAPAARIDAEFRPGDAHGRWFAGDPTLWVRYPDDTMPVHRIRLRLELERPGGRRHGMVVSCVLPAMSWTAEQARPHARAAEPERAVACVAAGPSDSSLHEPRSWRPRPWNHPAPGLA
ncbi:MAG: hypothetical protein P4L73_18795, partial [Caulobacteraceae bacterium]|nr:hypothetical protein [Caulobacteraceae bacterium]